MTYSMKKLLIRLLWGRNKPFRPKYWSNQIVSSFKSNLNNKL